MRRKLWPKAPANEGALGQMSKKFPVYFIHINYFKKPNKQIYNRAEELYCDATIFFLILYCLLAQKKWKLKNGPRLPSLPYNSFFVEFCLLIYIIDCRCRKDPMRRGRKNCTPSAWSRNILRNRDSALRHFWFITLPILCNTRPRDFLRRIVILSWRSKLKFWEQET